VEPSRWGDSVLGQYFAANQNDVLDVWDSLTTMTTSVKDILEVCTCARMLCEGCV
jgi:hypothetical protein